MMVPGLTEEEILSWNVELIYAKYDAVYFLFEEQWGFTTNVVLKKLQDRGILKR